MPKVTLFVVGILLFFSACGGTIQWSGSNIPGLSPPANEDAGGGGSGTGPSTARGALDTTFSSDGWAAIPIGTIAAGYAVAMQPDGKIVAAGTGGFGNNEAVVVRCQSDGELDTTFGDSGIVRVNASEVEGLGSEVAEEAHAMAVDTAGRIVVVGSSGSRYLIIRLAANGDLDSSFDGNGVRILTSFMESGETGRASAVRLSADGKILMAGRVSTGTGYGIGIARLDNAGAVDPTFSSDGMEYSGISMTAMGLPELGILGTQFFVGVENFFSSAHSDMSALRYTASGIDSGYGVAGQKLVDFGDERNEGARGIVVHQNGKITLGGFANDGSQDRFALARVEADGISMDTSFGTNGMVDTSLTGLGDKILAMGLHSDGKIITAGSAANGSLVGVARYRSNGALDTSFADQGTRAWDLLGEGEILRSLYIAPDGKILLAGSISIDLQSKLLVMRLE